MTLPERCVFDRAKIDVTLRLLKLKARTRTIRLCTGLSNDRIRRIFDHYGPDIDLDARHTPRGKPPGSSLSFTRLPKQRFEATTLALLFKRMQLLHGQHQGIELGQRVCRVYETFIQLHPHTHISFEKAWALLVDLNAAQDVIFEKCKVCNSITVRNLMASTKKSRLCPLCAHLNKMKE